MVKVVANEIVELQLKKLQARSRWYLSLGLAWLALLLIGIAIGWPPAALIALGLLGLGYALALADHVSSIRELKRRLRS